MGLEATLVVKLPKGGRKILDFDKGLHILTTLISAEINYESKKDNKDSRPIRALMAALGRGFTVENNPGCPRDADLRVVLGKIAAASERIQQIPERPVRYLNPKDTFEWMISKIQNALMARGGDAFALLGP
ncbi:MAG: hypothetical protein Q9218_003167 [Villophora microphyllina]